MAKKKQKPIYSDCPDCGYMVVIQPGVLKVKCQSCGKVFMAKRVFERARPDSIQTQMFKEI